MPADHEIICGRNACAEAARARVPVTRVFMAVSAENDDRLGAVVRRATLEGAPVFEVTKLELEALTQAPCTRVWPWKSPPTTTLTP